jgi:hypothetical protein
MPPHCGAELPQSFGGSTQVQPDAAVPLQILPGGQTPPHAGAVAFPHSVGGGGAQSQPTGVDVHTSPAGHFPPHCGNVSLQLVGGGAPLKAGVHSSSGSSFAMTREPNWSVTFWLAIFGLSHCIL